MSALPWRLARHALLRERSDQLLGPPSGTDQQPTLRFIVTSRSVLVGGTTVELDSASTLADVHDLCRLIIDACLGGDTAGVHFIRSRRGEGR